MARTTYRLIRFTCDVPDCRQRANVTVDYLGREPVECHEGWGAAHGMHFCPAHLGDMAAAVARHEEACLERKRQKTDVRIWAALKRRGLVPTDFPPLAVRKEIATELGVSAVTVYTETRYFSDYPATERGRRRAQELDTLT